MPSIPRMYSIALFFIAGTGYRGEKLPSIPRIDGKTCFLATGTGDRSEKTAIYTPYRRQNLLFSDRNGVQAQKMCHLYPEYT